MTIHGVQVSELAKRLRERAEGIEHPGYPLSGDLLAAAEIMQRSDWRPIESAPKDGTRIRLWVPDMPEGHKEQYGRWNLGQYANKPKPYWTYRCYLGKTAERAKQPTHWRPLASPPEVKP